MAKLLLTGINGFLGKVLKSELNGHRVIGLDRSGTDINCDISKDVPVLAELYDIVIHCAGKAHFIPKNQTESDSFFQVNFEGTKRVCEALENSVSKPKCFVLISSVSVYGEDTGIDILESYPLKGNSPYAKSKIMAEEFVKNWCTSNNVNYLIFRLPLIVADNPPGNLGKMIEAIRNKRFFLVGNGEAKKSMIVARDLIPPILNNSDKSGVFNLSDGIHPSFAEVEQVIVEGLKVRPSRKLPHVLVKSIALIGDILPFFPLNTLVYRKMILDLTFNDEKARNELGWKPSSAIEELKKIKL